MAVSIAKISKRASVSSATVCKVLRGYKEISEKTKANVLKIAAEMGYTPRNEIARFSRKYTLNLVFYKREKEDIAENVYFRPLVKFINDRFQRDGYLILESYPQNHEDYSKLLESSRADGTLLLSSFDSIEEDFIPKLRIYSNHKPLILVSNYLSGYIQEFYNVRADNFSAGYSAAKYFIEKGINNIFFIGSIPNVSLISDRNDGYNRAMQDSGLEPKVLNIPFGWENRPITQNGSIESLVSSVSGEIGFICGTDLMCFQFANYLKHVALLARGRMHFIGINGYPELLKDDIREATVKVDLEAMANECYNLFDDILEKRVDKPKHILVGVELLTG